LLQAAMLLETFSIQQYNPIAYSPPPKDQFRRSYITQVRLITPKTIPTAGASLPKLCSLISEINKNKLIHKLKLNIHLCLHPSPNF